MTTISILQF